MQNETLVIISNIIQIVLVFAGGVLAAWFGFRSKSKETQAGENIAQINSADDMITAYGSLQAQLAQAAQNMVQPLNEQVTELTRRLAMANEETKQLRDFVKEKSNQLEVLSKRVQALETENAALRGELAKTKQNEQKLRQRLNTIRREIDTGELPSNIHKLPEED